LGEGNFSPSPFFQRKNREIKKKMAKKREKNLIPFEKGQSGNPNGRPPGGKNLKTLFKKVAEMRVDNISEIQVLEMLKTTFPEEFKKGKVTLEDAIVLRLGAGCLHSDAKTALYYIREFLDRIDGKPSQKVEREDLEGNKVEAQVFDLGNGRKIIF
jgi:hypothetical protein